MTNIFTFTLHSQSMGHVRRQEWHKGVGLSVFIGLGNFIEFPGGSEDKASACHAGDPGSIPGLGRSPGEGNVYPIQYSCLDNLMDRGAWQAIVMGSQRIGHD